MSMTISVRYEPKQDLDFITGVSGLTMSETLRSHLCRIYRLVWCWLL
ncbi:MAG: hypothetical protein U9N05_03905 [Euryarchaeota archaeon]|nr:hypothetical protein [Euryarchaeota archaeon]